MSEDLEILNIDIVNEAKELMNDRFPMMVKYFLEDTQMYFEEIERAVTENNVEIAISPAHTIKSSAKQVGAERVSKVAKDIEELCRSIIEKENNDFAQFVKLTHEIKHEIDLVTPELEKLCE